MTTNNAKINQINDNKSSVTKVSMNLTGRDMENVDYLSARLNARNQVIAVSRAMEITRHLIENIDNGQTLLLKNREGDLKEVQILF